VIAETISDISLTSRRSAAFDGIARDYDRVFTYSLLGKAHRSLIHEALSKHLWSVQRVLDLNCGTGEDALHLASLGMSVLGCDVSEGMIEIAREKAARSCCGSRVEFAVCANERLGTLIEHAPFDLILSNFGGLNCTADLHQVARDLSRLVRPGGEVFLCMIGKICAWEILWYGARGKRNKAFRRLSLGGTSASISGASIQVRYPSVRKMRRAFAPVFRLESWRGIGVVLPPSWLASAVEDLPGLVKVLKHVDRQFGMLPVLRGLADHTLFRFVREEK
jgi:ubiquinone/menaquinone biosynthesis C-methylase UbiE